MRQYDLFDFKINTFHSFVIYLIPRRVFDLQTSYLHVFITSQYPKFDLTINVGYESVLPEI